MTRWRTVLFVTVCLLAERVVEALTHVPEITYWQRLLIASPWILGWMIEDLR